MVTLITASIPSEMKKLPQWVMWKLVPRKDKDGNEKLTKEPYQINGRLAKSDDPKTWSTFEQVCKTINSCNGTFTGIGFVFTEEAGIIGVDFDHVRENGVWNEEVLKEIRSFNSYWEVSQSGTGAHVYIHAKMSAEQLDGRETGRKNGIREVYYRKRFFAVTGDEIDEITNVNEAQEAFDNWFETKFMSTSKKNENVEKKEKPEKKSKEEKIKFSPELTDEEVITLLSRAKNSEKFKKLYENGNIEGYNSASDAVLALCDLIVFYTQDFEQVDRIFRTSKLMYDKWDRIGEMTYLKAMSGKTKFYQGKSNKLNLDSTSSKNYAYHVLAKEYMENHSVKYVCGSLRTYENGIYPASTDSEIFIKKDILNLALENHDTYLSDSNVNEVMKVINMLSAVKKEDCEPNTDSVIVVNNGILNLKTFELMPHDPEKVYFTKSPVDYDPNAKEPVLFNKFIEMIFKGNEDQKNLFQEMMGYCLCDNYKYQAMFHLLGDGGNGKGTAMQIITALLGEDNTSSYSIFQLTDHRNVDYFVAGLHGKKANICGDVGSTRIENTETIKKLTSNTDYVTGRFPCEKAFEFINHAKLVFAENKMPKRDAFTTGDKRRNVIIHFINPISDTAADIKDYASKIIENGELSGILLWAIEGLKRLEAQQKFSDDKTTAQKGLEYDMVSNPMKYFVADCIEEDEVNGGGCVPTVFAYDAYNKYRKSRHMPELSEEEIKNGIRYHCKQAGIGLYEKRILKSKILGIADADLASKLGKQVTCFMNIKLVSESQENKTNPEETAEEELKRQTREMEELDLKGQCATFLIDNPQYNIATVTSKAAAHALITRFPNIGLINGMDRVIETISNCKRGCRA